MNQATLILIAIDFSQKIGLPLMNVANVNTKATNMT